MGRRGILTQTALETQKITHVEEHMIRVLSRHTGKWPCFVAVLSALLLASGARAQETTAGLQGNVKDASGGAIAKANVEVTSPALIGIKKAQTDVAGYYRFANLPPGTYTLTVTAAGFRTYKQDNLELLVGHLPTLDVTMQVGAVTETVDVSAQAALIDPTQSKVQTNIPDTSLMNLPTQSLSFQSVIQFAPGARTEPLQNGFRSTALPIRRTPTWCKARRPHT